MKIYFKEEGGFGSFPGLNKPLEINSDDLPVEEAKQLEQLVNKAEFSKGPSPRTETSKGADLKKYTIAVEDKGQQFSATLTDTDTNSQLKNLLSYLRKKQKESRSH